MWLSYRASKWTSSANERAVFVVIEDLILGIENSKRGSTKADLKYRVIHKKMSHKTEDKMQEKMKRILQVDENWAHIWQQYSESFCKKIDSKSAFL